ncbi:MAG: hypothetical protein Kow0092_24380 [Deferrisomatales bacterium]
MIAAAPFMHVEHGTPLCAFPLRVREMAARQIGAPGGGRFPEQRHTVPRARIAFAPGRREEGDLLHRSKGRPTPKAGLAPSGAGWPLVDLSTGGMWACAKRGRGGLSWLPWGLP